ncbi:MAG: electron transport complex subunit RsxE [Gammaproteobacteria bacterium]|nr:electron transport complex subunit RsxE [Gammaproteobacteria bacterium]
MATHSNKPTAYDELLKGLWRDNPVFVQVLGMCPMLAVTNSAFNAVVMGLATFFVLVGSSLLVSALRQWIPRPVRISVYVIIIATFVTVADYTLLALLPAAHKELGAFLPLIVANCMILGRQEAFASKHTVKFALMDAIGMASGFMLALFALGSVREILGEGKLFGLALFGDHFEPWVIMILPPGGFLTLGLLLLIFNWVTERKREFLAQVAEQQAGNR